jgi:hypothetical protein
VKTLAINASIVLFAVVGFAGCRTEQIGLPPRVEQLAAIRPGTPVVVFPVRASIRGCGLDPAEASEDRDFIARTSRESLVRAFSAAGHPVIRWGRIENLCRPGRLDMLGEDEVDSMHLLYAHLEADLAAFCDVRADVNANGPTTEIVQMRIYHLRDGQLLREYRWKVSPDMMGGPVEPVTLTPRPGSNPPQVREGATPNAPELKPVTQ